MRARDVMVSPVITVDASATIREVAKTLLDHRISGAPVVDDGGTLVGIVSEGDLLHRTESGTKERPRSWWLRALAADHVFAADYVKAHSKRVSKIMSPKVVTASPDTLLSDIAVLMETHSIKRVPIVTDGQLVGIVSRANLVQAIASAKPEMNLQLSDTAIRERLLLHLRRQPWAHTYWLNVTVHNGVVDLWGFSSSDAEREAIRVAAENIPGVRGIHSNLAVPL